MINWQHVPERVQAGVTLLAAAHGAATLTATVTLSQGAPGLTLTRHGATGTITYGSAHDLMRAVTLWLGHAQTASEFDLTETPHFDEASAMIDLARNGVLTVAALKDALVRFAGMGYTEVWLYLEDLYEVPEEPYFGRQRGRYSQADLHELAVFADQFGLRLMPAIQTLAHLSTLLKWRAFSDVKDEADVLWVEKPETTAFLRHVLKAASAPFLTNKIHIGMDEAYWLGRGARLDKEGYVDQGTLIQAHLKTVLGLCAELDLDPYMWSDMWFTIASPIHQMYDESVHFTPEFVAGMPKVGQVFWDYYHQDEAIYEVRMRQHQELQQALVFAAGVWTWNGFAPLQTKMLQTIGAGMRAAKAVGVRQACATMWFDEGSETPFGSGWLGFQTFIEYQYHDQVDAPLLRQQFALMQGEDYDAFMMLERFDTPAGAPVNLSGDNPSMLVLYGDPLIQKFAVNLGRFDLAAHYRQLAADLAQVKVSPASAALFHFYHLLALALAAKAALLPMIQDLPAAGPAAVPAVQAQLDATLAALRPALAAFRDVWFSERKGNGFEVADIRLSGVIGRLETTRWRLARFAAGTDDLAELREPLLPADKHSSGPIGHGNYHESASVNEIAR